MDTIGAFCMGEAARIAGNETKVFDWHKAARIIRERSPRNASAGLAADWEYTGGTIYVDGDPVKGSGCYLASIWATPQLDIDDEIIDCWILDTPETNPEAWDASTEWPDSALTILSGHTK